MTKRLGAALFAGCMAIASARAEESVPADPLPVTATSAVLPQVPRSDRPTELPNIDPRTDLPSPDQTPTPSPRPRWSGPPSNYDPSSLYLPERNPGIRQPPCPCLPLGDFWFNGSYFLGKTQTDSAPALVTRGGSGIVGTPGVSILQGNSHIDYPFSSGIRLETGAWLDRCHTWGIEGSFFDLTSSQSGVQASSTGDPLIGRPYTAQPGNVASVDAIAAPGVSRGWVYFDSPISFLGADANARFNLFCEDRYRLDFVSGYRFVRMSEGVTVHSYSQLSSGASAGSTTEIADDFHTQNLFNGAQIGLAGEYRFDRFYISGATKCAFGVNWYELDINGWTRMQSAGGTPVTVPTGLLAQASNSGSQYARQFAVVPEANFAVGYQITNHWRAQIAYSFIYMSSVARPGPAIDNSIGTSGGVTHPLVLSPTTDFWMQGINFAFEARY